MRFDRTDLIYRLRHTLFFSYLLLVFVFLCWGVDAWVGGGGRWFLNQFQVPKSCNNLDFSHVKNNMISSTVFSCSFSVLGVVFWVEFQTLDYSKISISLRRNTHFHDFSLPNSRSKNESPQSSEKTSFCLIFGPLFSGFWHKKRYQKLGEKKRRKQVNK